MSYTCQLCKYKTYDPSNLKKHLLTKKHKNLECQNIIVSNKHSNTDNTNFICENCDKVFLHKSSLSRHKIKCCDNKVGEIKKELKKIKTECDHLKSENTILRTVATNASKIASKNAETIHLVTTSALKYANTMFPNTPALIPINNFSINNLNFDNENDKKQLIELLIYHAKFKSLDKLLGDHIIKQYKKDNPKEQTFYTTDSSRLNYIIRDLIDDALRWSIDKNGIKICSSIIKPLIKKCIDLLLEHQKILLKDMYDGEFSKQKDVSLILDIIISIDFGILEYDINKYIAPYFSLNKFDGFIV